MDTRKPFRVLLLALLGLLAGGLIGCGSEATPARRSRPWSSAPTAAG